MRNSYNIQTGFTGFPEPYLCPVGKKNPPAHKSPMLIVGANGFTRDYINYQIQQRFDIYYFFFSTNKDYWTTGIVVISKKNPAYTYFIHSMDKNIQQCIKKCVIMMEEMVKDIEDDDKPSLNQIKLSVWLTKWIYRCPKVSMKDVLHMEDYKENHESERVNSQITGS